MAEHKNDCIVCGAPLVYLEQPEDLVCHDCQRSFTASVRCQNGHFICDACHSQTTNEWILQQCLASEARNPHEFAVRLMKDSRLRCMGLSTTSWCGRAVDGLC